VTHTAVLFDCDGVLVDSEGISNALLCEDLAAHGLALDPGEVQRLFVGGTMAAVAEGARALGADLPGDWVERHYRRLYARLAEGTPLIAGVEAVLDRLDAAAVPYAVGSNGSTEKMTITLSQHPSVWARVKDHLYSGQELGCPKPEPGLYLHAATALGVDPAACVVVDDSPSGCRAGVADGCRTLGFDEHGDGARLTEVGAEVFHDMAEVPALLGLER
jgi:HAD superfamily hydrolase (TIGR01509 family)